MKVFAVAALSLLCCALPACAAETVRNVKLDVTDSDPKGTHVPATPGGAEIATFVNKGDWIEQRLDQGRLPQPAHDLRLTELASRRLERREPLA